MRRLFTLVLCLFLLSGCMAKPLPGTEPTQGQASPGASLLDRAEAVGTDGNLFYIPNPHVEAMACPELRLYGNSLLLYEQGMDGVLQLKRISLEDGSLLAQAAIPATPAVTVQIGNGVIGLCDSGSGRVLLLNDALETETTYTIPWEDETWFLNRELETLYLFFPEKGLQSRDLLTGQTRWLLENAAQVQIIGAGADYVLFSYTDLADQKTYRRSLNLSAQTLETLPLEGYVSSGVRSGGHWLLRQDIATGGYVLVEQERAFTFTWPEGLVQLIPGPGQLLLTDADYRELSLYRTDGTFLSRCSLPKEAHASVGTDLVWSGYRKGYFFRDTYNNAAHLMFWDPNGGPQGENLAVTPPEAVLPPEPVLEQALYEEAAAISQRFGLDIRIAEQCALEYSHYQADALTDPYLVRRALQVLELALGYYPQGFFHQLPHGEMTHIRIELVAEIRGQEGMDTHPTAANGFLQEMPDHYLMVLAAPSLEAETVFHEFSHVIDKRLAWDARLRPEALYSEEAWLSYQPEGFRYAESYLDMPADVAAFENSGYFQRRYSMTFPTEDRATLMALAIADPAILEHEPHMAEKMRYYAACIRDCFDTTNWPEKTMWE